VYIPIDQIYQLTKCCEYLGVSREQLIGHADMDENVWHRDIVPLKNFIQLVDAALVLTDDPHIGIVLGKQLNFMKHGAVGALAFASPTGAESLLAFVNHSQEANAPFMKIQQHVVGEEIRITLTPSLSVQSIKKFVVDTALSSCITMIRAMMSGIGGDPRIKKAIKYFSVTYVSPSVIQELHRYQDALVVPVKFGQPECQIVFHRDIVDKENPYASSGLIDSMAKAIKPIPSDDGEPLVSKIEQCLAAYNFRFPALKVIAVQLCMSERTLHRRLAGQGVKYRAICDALRGGQAREWMATAMPVDEVAYRLGYFDAASFYKAFKRWEGMSPSDYRMLIKKDRTL
jgi:AraC-like DNA-binding protein